MQDKIGEEKESGGFKRETQEKIETRRGNQKVKGGIIMKLIL